MPQRLSGKNVMVLVSNGVDEAVMSSVQRDIIKTGAKIKVVSTDNGLVNSWNGKNWGLYFPVDANINSTLGSDFDMLVVPSGKMSVEKLASNPHFERVISSFITAQKPMFFLGNAAELLKNIDHSERSNIIATGDVGGELASSIFSMIMHFADGIVDQQTEMKQVA